MGKLATHQLDWRVITNHIGHRGTLTLNSTFIDTTSRSVTMQVAK